MAAAEATAEAEAEAVAAEVEAANRCSDRRVDGDRRFSNDRRFEGGGGVWNLLHGRDGGNGGGGGGRSSSGSWRRIAAEAEGVATPISMAAVAAVERSWSERALPGVKWGIRA